MLLTLIGRIPDGLPLAATIRDEEQQGKNLADYQNQAKMLFRKLQANSPSQFTLETGPYFFHGIIENSICYLVLCERNYSRRLAFSFLEDIAVEFGALYSKRVSAATRPYMFIEFDNYIQKAKRKYSDSRVRRTLDNVNNDLQDVQRIMVQNIDNVLQRGGMLSELDNKAQSLSMMSQKYKKDAAYLNTKSMYMKLAAAGVVLTVFILYFWVL